jgi:DDE family transposase
VQGLCWRILPVADVVIPVARLVRHGVAPRQLTLRPRAEHEAIARDQQATQEWKRRYDRRAGVEGTISQAVRAFGLRRTRYIGLAKTRLQHVLTAIAVNLARLNAWLLDTPHGKTRTTRFHALQTAA